MHVWYVYLGLFPFNSAAGIAIIPTRYSSWLVHIKRRFKTKLARAYQPAPPPATFTHRSATRSAPTQPAVETKEMQQPSRPSRESRFHSRLSTVVVVPMPAPPYPPARARECPDRWKICAWSAYYKELPLEY